LIKRCLVSDVQICIILFLMSTMKLQGGYNINIQGRPEPKIKEMPEPEVLCLGQKSRRFHFTQLRVGDRQSVSIGQALAVDPENYNVPLLAPRTGTVRLNQLDGHIVLEDIKPFEKETAVFEQPEHISIHPGHLSLKHKLLFDLGAWQFFSDAFTGSLPDPMGNPQAVIISTLSLEPFLARGDVQLDEKLLNFTRGLEQLQSLLEYQPMYLVMPRIDTELATKVHEHIRGYAWVEMIEIPLRYPFDNFTILARHLGLKPGKGPVWSLRTEGIIAVDSALTMHKPCIQKIISIGGPAVLKPAHFEVCVGYPLDDLLRYLITDEPVRILDGGVMTGDIIGDDDYGLDTECTGLTVLQEHRQREFLAFLRPGFDRRSYSNCFLSTFRKAFPERLNTALRGELRPCISCNYCEEVCPAGIMPHLIHKYLYADLLDEAEDARIDLCIECGLCSFVCPSKIDLKREFVEAKRVIQEEKEEILKEQRQQEELQRNIKEEQAKDIIE